MTALVAVMYLPLHKKAYRNSNVVNHKTKNRFGVKFIRIVAFSSMSNIPLGESPLRKFLFCQSCILNDRHKIKVTKMQINPNTY